MVARLFLASSCCVFATAAQAGETKTFTYDALGRLVGSTSAGTVNNGLSTTVSYDPAGNRSCYTVTGAASGTTGSCGTSSPPPSGGGGSTPPSSSNQAPVTVSDRYRVTQCTPMLLDVLTNDSDPDGDPLSIASFTVPAGSTVSNEGDHLEWWPTASATSFSGTYTVSDGRGGTATQTFLVQVLVSC